MGVCAFAAGLPCLHICQTFSLALIGSDKQLTGELNPFVGGSVLSSAQELGGAFVFRGLQVNIILSVTYEGERGATVIQELRERDYRLIVESSDFKVMGRVF